MNYSVINAKLHVDSIIKTETVHEFERSVVTLADQGRDIFVRWLYFVTRSTVILGREIANSKNYAVVAVSSQGLPVHPRIHRRHHA